MNFLRPRLRRDRFDTADPKRFCSPRQLPALRECNRGTDAGVGTGAKPDRQAIDVLAFQFRGAQGGFDQTQGAALARGGFLSAPANLAVYHECDASLTG